MIEQILNLIYPNVCGICGTICKDNICKKCETKLKQYEINKNTIIKSKYIDESFFMYKYEGMLREKIIDYKFNENAYLYKMFSKIILKNKKICGFLKKYDIIIPVPIHNVRKRHRGYNQTELIAKQISKKLEIKLENNVLIKNKNIISQSELDKKSRIENIKNAFIVENIDKIINKNIVIFDDIYTTGSTLNECSKMLKEVGAKKIGILTIAKD